jgi:hypothetical protein
MEMEVLRQEKSDIEGTNIERVCVRERERERERERA